MVTADPVLGVHMIVYEVRAAPPLDAGAFHAAFTAPEDPVSAVNVPITGVSGTPMGRIPGTAVE